MSDQPNNETLFQDAVNLQSRGQLGPAEALYTQIILSDPNHLNAFVNLGALLIDLGRPGEAVRYLKQAVHLDPQDAEALNNLGNALQKSGQPEEALGYFEGALKNAPDNAFVLSNLARAHLRNGDYEIGLDFLARAIAADPKNSALKIIDCLALPMIPSSLEQLNLARRRCELKLTELEILPANEIVLHDPASEIGTTNFALSYHGQDDRDIQERLAELYLKICPDLAFVAPHITKPRQAAKIKIGFVSAHLGSHTIGKLNRRLLTGLDQTKFETHIFCPGTDKRGQDDILDEIAASADHIYFPRPLLAETRASIEAAKLDILYYLDIGMEPLTYFMAFSRLAKIQCVTVGHPVTTGIPAIDYFLSSKLVEPDGAEAHYSEKLVKLDSFFADYPYPRLPETQKARSDFGLNDAATLYFCPQSLFKFHPNFDQILAGILAGDPTAEIVLLAGPQRNWSTLLADRFSRILDDAARRITILPRQSGGDFLQLMSLADVVLDTPHFSGGNTSYEAFALGKVIVTLPGEFMRSRVTAGLYLLMAIDEPVAHSPENSVEIALKLGLDPALRANIENQIKAAADTIFETNSAIRSHEQFFLEALAIAPH